MGPSIIKANLSDFTTFRLGGPCKGLIKVMTPDECVAAIKYLNQKALPFIVIGSGSNLVVSDYGLDCYVLRYVSDAPLYKVNGNEVTVSGGTNLNDFAKMMAQSGLSGINYCSGIPGTVAGAVVGNAGAFGKQVGDVLKEVSLIKPNGHQYILKKDELGFSYRHSNLKELKDVVLEVVFKFDLGDRDELLAEREQILKVRSEKHPDLSKEPCAGSFFRNIEPTSNAGKRQATGWFLEEAGGKALKAGGAYIFDKHANIIIKGENCTAEDVYALSEKMKKAVKAIHGLDIIREVRFVGKFENKPASITDIIW